ncbi:hypoxia induced protein conserved region-domain-containing protein [Lineolata rhizophorae]|uniref:Hypoxia induced protein conserved region-domain-containing protein n=1 Tax=Lineolata rhizophorae TaxID=578093 RepID=A0A6A6NSL4_9PEZI|nr:hypoxia induced protein conserved region-domain-containing protein [Lineolata rhizophorae]
MNTNAPPPSSFDNNPDFYEENRWQKLFRRMREEPLIPLGCCLTVWALLGATRKMKAGDHHGVNRMFRRRIYAQGFTILAMVAGSIYWREDHAKRKEFEKAVEGRKQTERRDAWLRELEARDEEEKAMRAKLERQRRRMEDRKLEEAQEKVEGVVEAVKEKVVGGGDKEGAAKGAQSEVRDVESGEEKRGISLVDSVKGLLGR